MIPDFIRLAPTKRGRFYSLGPPAGIQFPSPAAQVKHRASAMLRYQLCSAQSPVVFSRVPFPFPLILSSTRLSLQQESPLLHDRYQVSSHVTDQPFRQFCPRSGGAPPALVGSGRSPGQSGRRLCPRRRSGPVGSADPRGARLRATGRWCGAPGAATDQAPQLIRLIQP